MIILDYTQKNHKKIINLAVKALKAGKVVAFPTDTSYGLACDVTNKAGVKKLYLAKERLPSKPVHIIPPNKAYAKRVVKWNSIAQKLSIKFWPGALTLVLPLKLNNRSLQIFTGNTENLGLRIPKNKIAQDLSSSLGRPITATSANPSAHLSGGYDSYSASDVIKQFSKQRHKPDIIINAGRLPKVKPSTVLLISAGELKILRKGPVTLKQIKKVLK